MIISEKKKKWRGEISAAPQVQLIGQMMVRRPFNKSALPTHFIHLTNIEGQPRN